MKRQLAHRIHKLFPTALPLLILILIFPLTSQATPYVYTYKGNLCTSANGGHGYPLEAIGDHVSVQCRCDGDLSDLNQTQTFEISSPNIANIVETCTEASHTPQVWGPSVFYSVPGHNGPPPSWSIYGEPYMLERLAFVNQSIPISKSLSERSRTPITHHKVQLKRLPSPKLTRNEQSTKAPLLHPVSHP